MLEELKNIFEDIEIDEDTQLKDLPMDSINILSIYLIFEKENINISYDKITEFKTIGDIVNYYESNKQ